MGYLALGCIGVTNAVADWRSILGVQIYFSQGAYFPQGSSHTLDAALMRWTQRHHQGHGGED